MITIIIDVTTFDISIKVETSGYHASVGPRTAGESSFKVKGSRYIILAAGTIESRLGRSASASSSPGVVRVL